MAISTLAQRISHHIARREYAKVAKLGPAAAEALISDPEAKQGPFSGALLALNAVLHQAPMSTIDMAMGGSPGVRRVALAAYARKGTQESLDRLIALAQQPHTKMTCSVLTAIALHRLSKSSHQALRSLLSGLQYANGELIQRCVLAHTSSDLRMCRDLLSTCLSAAPLPKSSTIDSALITACAALVKARCAEDVREYIGRATVKVLSDDYSDSYDDNIVMYFESYLDIETRVGKDDGKDPASKTNVVDRRVYDFAPAFANSLALAWHAIHPIQKEHHQGRGEELEFWTTSSFRRMRIAIWQLTWSRSPFVSAVLLLARKKLAEAYKYSAFENGQHLAGRDQFSNRTKLIWIVDRHLRRRGVSSDADPAELFCRALRLK